jgi:uncharacterized protein YoxC
MYLTVAPVVAVTSSDVLRYAAAFFFVLVAIGIAYACFKVAKTLDRVDVVMADVDREAVPLMQKAGVTLDNVNANLSNVDDITKDVADITDKIDSMATAIEGAVTKPARKAAAFSAGVQTAVSSFMRRDKAADAPDSQSDGEPEPQTAGESEPRVGDEVRTGEEDTFSWSGPPPAGAQAADVSTEWSPPVLGGSGGDAPRGG